MHSIWETKHFHHRPDLVVIGAGIVGLFTSLFYKRAHPGHRVLVLEKGNFPAGASVKNAGFACFGSPSELLADLRKEGEEVMLARVHQRWQGLESLRAELGDAAIGFEQCGGHEIHGPNDPLYTVVAEGFDPLNTSLRSIFDRDVFSWADARIDQNGLKQVAHMSFNPYEGALDSGALMSALLRKVIAEGVLVRTGTKVDHIEETPGHVSIQLLDTSGLHAAQVVVATNGYTNHLLPDLDVVPARGQVLITEQIPGLELKGTFHMDEGYIYFRELDGRVLIGGARNLDIAGETTLVDGTTALIQGTLENVLREVVLPGRNYTIAQRWSGVMGVGRSRTPIVERISDRLTVAVRLGGMGVAIGSRVGKRAAELVDDRA